MTATKSLVLLLLSIYSFSALAGPAANNLATCMTDKATGKERKDLVRWVFVGMSSHPEMKALSKVTPQVREDADRKMAALVMRLLTEQCVAQTRAASAETPGSATFLQAPFAALAGGAVAELMSDPGVSAASQAFAQYLDTKKFDAVVKRK